MKSNYQYASPSMCIKQGDNTVLGLSPDLSRDEKVSFQGSLKHPLVFRDAMLMLREIVISDSSQKKKERVEFFAWLEDEIERKIITHQQNMPGVRENIQQDINNLVNDAKQKDKKISELIELKKKLNEEINKYDIWKDYYKIERNFWKFIRERDLDLWFVLDPVITVHKEQVSFEAFSIDESTYGCLSIDMDEFELLQEPKLGTTNIDFSAKLAKEMERLRTYSKVELSVNPGGFTVDTGVMPEHIEKKIDIPETWIKGFNQVSSAASLGGAYIELTQVDMYDICSILRRNKERESPRYMKWVLEPGKHVKIIFEPFGKVITLSTIYTGEKKREEKIWGRRRWLVIEKIIPLAKSFKVRLLGFGMPQFIIADMGTIKMTIGFSSWSANDWVKGTAFNILGGYSGNGNYEEVYKLIKENRSFTLEDINKNLDGVSKAENKAGVGMLFRRGEGYFDPINDRVRFRQLCNIPIAKELYETTDLELRVLEHLKEGKQDFSLEMTNDKEYIARQSFDIPNSSFGNYRFRGTEDYDRRYNLSQTEITIDQDGQIAKVKCKCKEFNKGPRNISAPCSHILALYVASSKFLKLELKPEREYKMDDIMEILL